MPYTKEDIVDIVDVYKLTFDLSLAFRNLGISTKEKKIIEKDEEFIMRVASVDIEARTKIISEIDDMISEDDIPHQSKLAAIKEKRSILDQNRDDDPSKLRFPMAVDLSNLPSWG